MIYIWQRGDDVIGEVFNVDTGVAIIVLLQTLENGLK
jgi:hypothetical protein